MKDFQDFSASDLARLALSAQLQKLSDAFRLASVTPGVTTLAERLTALLDSEVPTLRASIAGYRGATEATTTHVADPAATAAQLDAWYLRHAQLEPLARVPDPFSRLLSGRTPGERACLICAKYAGDPVPPWAGFPVPPGGHLIDDDLWRVGHGPTPYWPAGTLLIESRRHFLDYADFAADEAASLGPLIHRLTEPLKQATGAPRVHLFSCMEGTEHFHLWMVPRVPGATEGRTFIAEPGYCTPAAAEEVVHKVRAALDAEHSAEDPTDGEATA